MTHPQPADGGNARRIDSERFVGFAFAGADLVAETDLDGTVTYAAGAFRSKFGRAPEAFVGHAVREMVAPADHDALEAALSLLRERGRLLPLMIRLADGQRTPLALAGIVLPAAARKPRLCLSFAWPPAPAGSVLRTGTAHGLARAAETRLRVGTACDLGLIEVVGDSRSAIASSEAIGQALEAVAPNAVASEIAPGRFGLLGTGGTSADLLSITQLLEAALRTQGVPVALAAQHLPLATEGLTPIQAARALRHALNVFAREGAEGFKKGGFGDGLAGYIRQAGTRAASLRRAIRAGDFTMAFQPIVSLADRAVHHYEALIRPKPIADCGVSGPQDFVMLVEALGLADELDLAVARLACEAAERAGTSVAFNLSGQCVQNPAFRERLTAFLATNPARRAGLVIVEMTETAEIEDVPEAARTADALRSLGVPFCMDDFGAGAADVRLLRALTADIVKLDGSYVPGVAENGRERAFVSGMVEIARAAGATTVAERVETEAEAEALRALGVQFGQGWLFGRPGALPSANTPATISPNKVGRRTGVKESWG